jgi:uncharacterized linocin/CFP29 family protein
MADILGRDRAPFSGRVWQEIDRAVASVKASNCTARRFLETMGPFGIGLTSLASDDEWLDAGSEGAPPEAWGVPRAHPPKGGMIDQGYSPRGTYLVSAQTRAVPMIANEFLMGIRTIEAFDDECQPLDVSRALRAARDVALEEERLIYYGDIANGMPGLLNPDLTGNRHETPLDFRPSRTGIEDNFELLVGGIEELAARGFGGEYALVGFPNVYQHLYGIPEGRDLVLVDLVRRLFTIGVHLAPAIQPLVVTRGIPQPGEPIGVIINGGPYVRLIIGQDWVVAYRGMSGVYHRFIIMNSFRLEILDPEAVEVLIQVRS